MGRVLVLENPVKTYAWGSRTAICDLTGRPNESGAPQAELWIGAHERGSSLVIDGDRRTPLGDLIRADREGWLGPDVAARYGQLPFLLKIIAAAEPLSIQCHPSATQAREGFARENAAGLATTDPHRSYRDENPKPELLCALTHFSALKGFRDRDAIARDLTQLDLPTLAPDLKSFEASGEVGPLYSAIMTRPPDVRVAMATRAAERAAPQLGESFELIVKLADRYPGDIGVISPAFLELVRLKKDEAIYLGAGELHAYLEGVGVEVMASSDNVIRGGLTPKHVDVDELLRIVRFDAPLCPVRTARPVAPKTATFDTPAEAFELTIVDVDPNTPHTATDRTSIELILVTEGSVVIEDVALTKGQAVAVAADVAEYRVECANGSARLYKAGVPQKVTAEA